MNNIELWNLAEIATRIVKQRIKKNIDINKVTKIFYQEFYNIHKEEIETEFDEWMKENNIHHQIY